MFMGIINQKFSEIKYGDKDHSVSSVPLESYKSSLGENQPSKDQQSIMSALLFAFLLFLPRNYTKNDNSYSLLRDSSMSVSH